jgi:CCR4-NOT transcription complex subunit 9
MMSAHLFSHQQQFPHVEQTWHQQAHAQAQAAQAAQAQYQHLSHNNHQSRNHSAALANASHGQESEGVTEENRKILGYVSDLLRDDARESALLELSKKREQVPELALILWHSFGKIYVYILLHYTLLIARQLGVMTSLLQEIISVYTLLNPSQLTAAASNRVCNALALLQCVASHNETRALFLNGTRISVKPVHISLTLAQLTSLCSCIHS